MTVRPLYTAPAFILFPGIFFAPLPVSRTSTFLHSKDFTMHRPFPRFIPLLLLIALSACTSTAKPTAANPPAPAAAAAPLNTILIDNFTFTPPSLTVPAGTTLTWINRDDVPHTVTSNTLPRILNSPALDTDQQFQFTFTVPGTYPYFCTLHPHMTATITVK
jgi:plastocyanin